MTRESRATAKSGDTVRIHYTCTIDDGSIVATTRNKEPLEFTLGNSQVIPGLQEAVIGMIPGESKAVQIPPERAYGPYHEEMKATLDRTMVPQELDLGIGVSLRVKHADGHESDVLVTGFTETTVDIDGNHPLAGRNLTMKIELLALDHL
jgi:FKBP-type peptidyl-prolyl cis-trans isomerase 2